VGDTLGHRLPPYQDAFFEVQEALLLRRQPGSVGIVSDWVPEDEKGMGEADEIVHQLLFGLYSAVPAVRKDWTLDVDIEPDETGTTAVAHVGGYSHEDEDAEGFTLTVPLEELVCRSEPGAGPEKASRPDRRVLTSYSREVRKQAAEKALPAAQAMLLTLEELEQLGGVLNLEGQLDEARSNLELLVWDLEELADRRDALGGDLQRRGPRLARLR
jgi:hypothetical protein